MVKGSQEIVSRNLDLWHRDLFQVSLLFFKTLRQVLHGDIEEAICHHALFYAIWKKYDCLPERYNWMLRMPDVKFYPLRPELVESTYLLYQGGN